MNSPNSILARVASEFSLKGNTVSIIDTKVEIILPREKVTLYENQILDDMKEFQSVPRLVNHYLETIENLQNEQNRKIDYTSVLPILISSRLQNEDTKLFERQNSRIPEVEVVFVQKVGEAYRYILRDEPFIPEMLKVAAFENLNKVDFQFSKLDDNLEIYAYQNSNISNASSILSMLVCQKVRSLVGELFIFMIPTSRTLIVASNITTNIDILKSFALLERSALDYISSDIYIYNGKDIRYLNPKKNIRVV